MGVLKDIVDVIKQADVGDMMEDKLKNANKTSISKMASDGILQFPVLVSRSLDIDTLQIITKALERNYANFVQITMGLNSTMEINKTKNASEYIKRFHQNSATSLTDNIIDSLESYNVYEDDNVIVMASVYEGSTARNVQINKDYLVDLFESLRTDILNDKYIPKNENLYNFTNKNLSAKYNGMAVGVTEAKNPSIEEKKLEYQKQKDAIDFDYKKQHDSQKMKMDELKHMSRYRDATLIPSDSLKDNDVKKSNELVPTTLHIRVKQTNENHEDVGIIDFIIGVKATMHPIKSAEMISNMVSACKNNNKVFNFIRWTTGEISFFKDFLFNISTVKHDIASKSLGSSPWWLALKRRKSLAKVKDVTIFAKKLLPNATIVLSIDEVNRIKSEFGYDIMSPIFVNKIMQEYFLLGLVVVDNSSQIAHFMFDGRNDFDSVSFSGLEKENSASERKFKEMLKAVNRT